LNQGNLIPAARRAVKARRRKIRRWSAIGGAYFGLLAVAAIGIGLFFGSEPVNSAALGKVKAAIVASNATLVSMRGRTAALRREIQLEQEISQQPDWSILLAAVAKRCGDDIVLSGCELAQSPDSIVLRVEGVGLSNTAVSAFVLRLQEIPVFEQVKLLQTSSKEILGLKGQLFQLTCSVSARAGGAHE